MVTMMNTKAMEILFVTGCNMAAIRKSIESEEIMKFAVFSELYKNIDEDVAETYFHKSVGRALEMISDILSVVSSPELKVTDAGSEAFSFLYDTMGETIMTCFRQWERHNEESTMRKFTNEKLLKYDSDSYFDE